MVEHLVANIPEEIPITISTNAAFKEDFEQWAALQGRSTIEILIEESKNDDQKLGALGATAQWITDAKVEDDVLLLTGDNYCGFSFEDFLADTKPETTRIAAYDIGDLKLASQFGTVITDGTQLSAVEAFEEKPKEPKTTLVNTGCSLLPASVLPILVEHAKLHPDNVGGIFEELLNRGRQIECFMFQEPWFDIGSFDAYIEATKLLVGNKVLQEEGALFNDSSSNGSVVLGKHSKVSASRLENTVVFEDCVIEDCILENCVLDKGCNLKGIDISGKMLREGTTLRKN